MSADTPDCPYCHKPRPCFVERVLREQHRPQEEWVGYPMTVCSCGQPWPCSALIHLGPPDPDDACPECGRLPGETRDETSPECSWCHAPTSPALPLNPKRED